MMNWETVTIHGWAVLGAAASAMVVGYFWYGPLFGKVWGRLTGWTTEKIQTLTPTDLGVQYGLALVYAAAIALTLDILLGWWGRSLVSAWILSGIVGFGVILPSVGTFYAFERQTWTLLAVNVGYRLVTVGIMATILVL